MGALLVTLLQCRSNQSLYPNISATQARLVTYQQPCSVPLLHHDEHTNAATTDTKRSASLTEAETAVNADVDAVRENFRVSPGSSELDGSPGFYQHHSPHSLRALHPPSKRNNAAPDAARKKSPAAAETNAEASLDEQQKSHEQQRQQQEHQRLYFGLTCQRHTSTDSESGKAKPSAIYRYTLPGATAAVKVGTASPSKPPASLALTARAAGPTAGTATTTTSAADAPSFSRLPLTNTSDTPSASLNENADVRSDGKENGAHTKTNTSSDAALEQTHLPTPQQRLASSGETGGAGSSRDRSAATPHTLTPVHLVPSSEGDDTFPQPADRVNGVARRGQEMHERGSSTEYASDPTRDVAGDRHGVASGKGDNEEVENANNSLDDAELGPMDCADAFQYYYDDDEGAYRDVESVVYVAPRVAQAADLEAVRRYYLNQRAALRGSTRSTEAGEDGAFVRSTYPAAFSGRLNSSSGTQTHFAGSNISSHPGPTNPHHFFPSDDVSFSENARSDQSGIHDSSAAVQDAGRFVSLVEEMYVACRRIGHAPFVCWRSVDRITPLPTSSGGLFRSGNTQNVANSSNYGNTSNSSSGSGDGALNIAQGEAEDDVSYLPGSTCSAATRNGVSAEKSSSNSNNFMNFAARVRSGIDRSKSVPMSAERPAMAAAAQTSPSLYYLGPQQYLTASVWWSRVEAFGFGLRSVGLQPGDFFGIVEDTRWEWLITCYAAWNIGLVVVVFDSSARTMRRVAMDTCGQMRAVVCSPHVQHALRRRFQHAAAVLLRHGDADNAEVDEGDATGCGRAGSTPVDGSTSHSTATLNDVDGSARARKTEAAKVNAKLFAKSLAPEGQNTASQKQHARQKQQQQERDRHVPLFIVVRSTAPVRDGEDTAKEEAARMGKRDTKSARGRSRTRSSTSTRQEYRSSRGGDAPTEESADDHADGEEDEEEEEEALWWSDILAHGEAKLTAWRHRKAREWRQQQQKQARVRFQQQQRQRWMRSNDVAGTTTLRLRSGPPLDADFSTSTQQQRAVSAVGSRDGSNVSATFTAPALGWAASSTFTNTTTATTHTDATMSGHALQSSSFAGVNSTPSQSSYPPPPQQVTCSGSSFVSASNNASGRGFALTTSTTTHTGTPTLSASTAPVMAVHGEGGRAALDARASGSMGGGGVGVAARTPSPLRLSANTGAAIVTPMMRTTTTTTNTASGLHAGHASNSPQLSFSRSSPPPPGQHAHANTSNVPTGEAAPYGTGVLPTSQAAATQLPLAPLRPDDLAFILYTEGDPKGVLLTHGALKASMAAHQEYLDTTDIGFDDGLRRSSGGVNEYKNYMSAAATSASATAAAAAGRSALDEGVGEDGSVGAVDNRLARYYYSATSSFGAGEGGIFRGAKKSTSGAGGVSASAGAAAARMPALRSRTAPAGRPSYLAYLPLHHISEFVAQATLLVRGVLVCYGTRRTLFDAFARPHGDLTEYKPSIFPALPATLARLHRAVQAMLSTGYRKLLFEVAYETRRQALRRGLQSPFVLSTIFAQPRELLGGRCRFVLAREAPLHPRDQEYLEVVCGVSVLQQFGPPEVAGCGLQQAYCAAHLDSVGGPLGPVEVKLRDVTGGWTHCAERPTGELLMAGPTVMAGYYCQPERTAEVLEKSGWLHARSVVERCPDGAFRLVASLRPHHAVTSNGQCIPLEVLEAVYARHPLCMEGGVCLLVHPYRRYICALVLSSEARVRAFVEHEVRAHEAQLEREAQTISESAAPTAGNSARGGGSGSGYSVFLHAAGQQLASSVAPPPSPPSAAPPHPLTALAKAMGQPGWWPQCLRDPALNTAAAQSLAAWAADQYDDVDSSGVCSADAAAPPSSFSGAAAASCAGLPSRLVMPHECVRHVRVLYDVWEASRHTRTATGRLFRYGIQCRYSAIIQELFAEPD